MEARSGGLGRRYEKTDAGSTRSRTLCEGLWETGDFVAELGLVTGVSLLTRCFFSEFCIWRVFGATDSSVSLASKTAFAEDGSKETVVALISRR